MRPRANDDTSEDIAKENTESATDVLKIARVKNIVDMGGVKRKGIKNLLLYLLNCNFLRKTAAMRRAVSNATVKRYSVAWSALRDPDRYFVITPDRPNRTPTSSKLAMPIVFCDGVICFDISKDYSIYSVNYCFESSTNNSLMPHVRRVTCLTLLVDVYW